MTSRGRGEGGFSQLGSVPLHTPQPQRLHPELHSLPPPLLSSLGLAFPASAPPLTPLFSLGVSPPQAGSDHHSWHDMAVLAGSGELGEHKSLTDFSTPGLALCLLINLRCYSWGGGGGENERPSGGTGFQED